jgi:Protein of unknown function (DUF3231)
LNIIVFRFKNKSEASRGNFAVTKPKPFTSIRQTPLTSVQTIPPFSEKLMIHCIYLLNGFSITGNAFGTFFTLRNDISMKSALIAKDIFFYGQEGMEIKIKHGWFEEPPQMEDRMEIIKNNQ